MVKLHPQIYELISKFNRNSIGFADVCGFLNKTVKITISLICVGAEAVRAWADFNEAAGGDKRLSAKAYRHATLMDNWPTKKLADLPPGLTPEADGAPD